MMTAMTDRSTATERAAASAAAGALPDELTELVAAAAAYSASPDERSMDRVVAQARDVTAAARVLRESEGMAAAAAAWAELQTAAAAATPTLVAVRVVLDQAQRVHRILSEQGR